MEIYPFLAGILVVGGFYMLYKMSQLQEEIKGIRNKLEQMASQMNLPENPINEELRELLKTGEDIKAVKVARETLGLSLLEGKQYVDALKNED